MDGEVVGYGVLESKMERGSTWGEDVLLIRGRRT